MPEMSAEMLERKYKSSPVPLVLVVGLKYCLARLKISKCHGRLRLAAPFVPAVTLTLLLFMHIYSLMRNKVQLCGED